MKITKDQSDAAVLKELGARIARCRLDMGLSRDTLAQEAGLSRSPVVRMERGESVQLASLVRVLRVLGLLDNLDVVAPEATVSPMQLLKLRGKERKRAPRQSGAGAQGKDAQGKDEKPWSWGDE